MSAANRPAQRRGLGRGLGSLIPTAPTAAGETPVSGADGESALTPVAGAYFAEIPVGQIQPNPVQPRQVFDEDAMAELVH